LEEGFEDEDEPQAEEPDGEEIVRADFCSNCGEPIDAEDEECASCGADLCPDCGTALAEDDDACPHCGAEFIFSCPECDTDLPADADVCPNCGYTFEEDEDEDG
jgi:RNA polymerase subunit RPABC4/transcription elongation factor Spt4